VAGAGGEGGAEEGGAGRGGFEDNVKSEERNVADQSRIKDLTHTDKYRIELRSYMHQEQFKDCQDEVPTLEKPFQCKECQKTFARAHDLWGHHMSYRGPAFKCNYQSCEEVFLRLPDFAVHYAAHGGQRLVVPDLPAEKKTLHITCPVCQTVVPGLYKLQRHKMKHDPELKYKCPACTKQFVKANTLRAHITNVHKGSKPQKKCTKCDVAVFSDNGLFAHMKSAHGDQSHSCPTCGEIFLLESQLQEHELSHLDKPKGSVKEDLEEPGSGREEGECPECEAVVGAGELAAHLAEVHAGLEARYQCSECSTAGPGGQHRFLSLETARRHYRRAHRGRPHTCWVCKENFGKEEALHLHLGEAHPEVVGQDGDECPVQCRYCTDVFPDHMERVGHTRYCHMVETIDITSTELDEVEMQYLYITLHHASPQVTMVGGHVIEFGQGSDQIVALHTIP
jgi:KRAB domain-containing zinc finger protein